MLKESIAETKIKLLQLYLHLKSIIMKYAILSNSLINLADTLLLLFMTRIEEDNIKPTDAEHLRSVQSYPVCSCCYAVLFEDGQKM